MTTPNAESLQPPSSQELELLKFHLERARYRADILKWVVVAIGAVVSFAVVDLGRLRLEQFHAVADSQRQLLDAYLKATESPEPEVWKRKLHVLENFADDKHMQEWAQAELQYIQRFAGLDALYRETLKVASQLVEPGRLSDPQRVLARVRYNQLYWADLPYARESSSVSEKMVDFRNKLIAAERSPDDRRSWDELNLALIYLSTALRDSTPGYPPPPATPGGAPERKE